MPSAPIMDEQVELQTTRGCATRNTRGGRYRKLGKYSKLGRCRELKDDVAKLDENEFSLDGEQTMDLQVILELYQDAIDEA